MILPWALPTLVAVLIWMWMYSDVGGVFNTVLMGTGIGAVLHFAQRDSSD